MVLQPMPRIWPRISHDASWQQQKKVINGQGADKELCPPRSNDMNTGLQWVEISSPQEPALLQLTTLHLLHMTYDTA